MIIDAAIRNTKIGDDHIHLESAVRKVEELTPFGRNPKVRNATTILQSGQSM